MRYVVSPKFPLTKRGNVMLWFRRITCGNAHSASRSKEREREEQELARVFLTNSFYAHQLFYGSGFPCRARERESRHERPPFESQEQEEHHARVSLPIVFMLTSFSINWFFPAPRQENSFGSARLLIIFHMYPTRHAMSVCLVLS